MRARPAGAAASVALWVAGCGGTGGAVDVPGTFTVEEDGSRRMSCPDGTSAVFPAPTVAPRTGSISGRASRFGEADRSGIDVWLHLAPELPGGFLETRHVVTDAEGTFRFDEVPPGVHDVGFTAPGFTDEGRDVVVDPGEFVIDPVVLRRGADALACERTQLFPSPRRNAFLARYGDKPNLQRLVYWEPGGAGMVPLGQRVDPSSGSNYFSADGRLVHFLEQPENDQGPVLYRYEIGKVGARPIAAGVTAWHSALGGDALVLWTWTGLKAWDQRFAGPDGSGALRTIAAQLPPISFSGPDGRLIAFVVDGFLVVWDMREMTGDTLGPFWEPPVFSPDGSILVAGFGDELVAWDADGPRRIRLGPGEAGDVRFHGSGRRFVYLEREGTSKRLVHVDLDRGAVPVPLRDRVEEAYYGPGDGGIAWIENVSGERHLFLAEAPAAAPVLVGRGDGISGVTFSRDGSRLYFLAYDGEAGTYRLDVYEAGLGAHTISSNAVFWPVLEPGGDGLFFFEPLPASIALLYWDPVTDEVVRIHEAVQLQDFEGTTGPGGRVLFADQGYVWHRWDPAARTVVPVGPNHRIPPAFRFLADGAVALADTNRHLLLLEPDADEPRIVGSGLVVQDLYGPSGDGLRFAYLSGGLWSFGGDGSLVLFDRALDRAIPLDDRVTTAVVGDTFVAYVRNVPATEEGSQRLFLATYPVEER